MPSKDRADSAELFLPSIPSLEIPRDAQVRQIAARFNHECQQQLVVGGIQTGKTNLLAQFVRQYSGRCVSYFITASPLTQRQHTFLYKMCFQMSSILEKASPPFDISLEDLKSLFSTLSFQLTRQAKLRKTRYYFVIDALEHGLRGSEGDRIIDLFPIDTSAFSPYLLLSCRSDQLSRITEYVECHTEEPWEFTRLDTETYLKELRLPIDEIDELQSKYHGVPGYLKIIRETKLARPEFDLKSAPVELDSLVSNQVEMVLEAVETDIKQALEILAVSPASVPSRALAELTDVEEAALVNSLLQTSLVVQGRSMGRLEYCNDLIQRSVKGRLGDRAKTITKKLLDHIRKNYSDEPQLLELLFVAMDDYDGLCSTLTHHAIITSVETVNDISGVIRRMRLASEMAASRHETNDVLRWSLGIATAKAFLSHALGFDEIRALLSIGESQAALSRAYAIPEISVKVRSLARAYASIRDRGEKIPRSALDELGTMVKGIDLDKLDKTVAQEMAVDLLPIIPDVAISLMESVIGESEKRSLVEATIEAVESKVEEQNAKEGAFPSDVKQRADMSYIAELLSSWLNELPLPELLKEVESIENTKAKEYMIRQWCRQNPESGDVASAVDLWFNTVIGDRDFVLVLRSLRHISQAVAKVSLGDRRRLIDRLRVPSFAALDSPKEEWARFHLNLAEALFEIDQEEALSEVKSVHDGIQQSVLDVDVRAFCYARLWATVCKVAPSDSGWISEIEKQFDIAFRALLDSSAEQLEPVIETLVALVEVDPICALTAASELNTYLRRSNAVQVILRTTLLKHSECEVADFIEHSLKQLDQARRDSALAATIPRLTAREVVLSSSNLDTLLRYSKEIADARLRAQALSHLARLAQSTSVDSALTIMDQAVEAWREEDDLRSRLALGFELVENMARLDSDKAKQLYDEVKGLKMQPGSNLAIGDLGPVFREVLDLAIRAVTIQDLTESDEALQSLRGLIVKIPSRVVRVHLYALLAAGVYRSGQYEYANEIVRTNVIPMVDCLISDSAKMESELGCRRALEISLPVIFEYDVQAAARLSDRLPYYVRDRAWCSTVSWLLSRSFLGDHHFKPGSLRVRSDYPRLDKSVNAAVHIDNDNLLCEAAHSIATSIGVSFDSKTDLAQALDVLQKLDEMVEKKLPESEGKNIEHKGYLVLAQAYIHGTRSKLYHRAQKKRGLTKKLMGDRWREITDGARAIPNIADRVFVMALIAPEIKHYYSEGHLARELLEEAESLIPDIPTITDRADRLSAIAEAWEALGEKTLAEIAIENAVKLATQLRGISADERLGLLVQAAHSVSPDFAEDLVSRLDTRLPGRVVQPAGIDLEVAKLIKDPSRIAKLRSIHPMPAAVIGGAARKLLRDFAAGKATVVRNEVLEDWLQSANLYGSKTGIEVAHWVIESLSRKSVGISRQNRLDIALDIARLAHELAQWISIARGDGLPQVVHESFPGLETRVELFRAGEFERAEKWLQDWLGRNVKEYVKICDPYFGLEQLEYLVHVPEGCSILVVTTDRYLNTGDGLEHLREEMKAFWDKLTHQAVPDAYFVIVPREVEDRFHDRAIVSREAGLDLGTSLNGLGRSHSKITILSGEDTNELERVYVDEMLNNATWFMGGVNPAVVSLRSD